MPDPLAATTPAPVNRFPGIAVSDNVITRLEAAGEDRRERARISIEIAAETARAVRGESFPGLHPITPLNRYDVTAASCRRWSKGVPRGYPPPFASWTGRGEPLVIGIAPISTHGSRS